MFPVAKRTLPILDAYFLGSIRYAIGTTIFVAMLWATEGRAALSYGGRIVPAVLFGVFGFTGFNVLVWLGLTYTRPEHAAIIMALQTPMTAIAVWLTSGVRPARFTMACIACAIAGVFLVVFHSSNHLLRHTPTKIALAGAPSAPASLSGKQ